MIARHSLESGVSVYAMSPTRICLRLRLIVATHLSSETVMADSCPSLIVGMMD